VTFEGAVHSEFQDDRDDATADGKGGEAAQ